MDDADARALGYWTERCVETALAGDNQDELAEAVEVAGPSAAAVIRAAGARAMLARLVAVVGRMTSDPSESAYLAELARGDMMRAILVVRPGDV